MRRKLAGAVGDCGESVKKLARARGEKRLGEEGLEGDEEVWERRWRMASENL